MEGYAKISEFRTMLERLDLNRELSFWEGHYFYVHPRWKDGKGVNFRARDNGIGFTFCDDWQSIKKLFRRAWQSPQMPHLGGVGAGIWRDVKGAVLRTGRNMDTSPPIWELRSAADAGMFTDVNLFWVSICLAIEFRDVLGFTFVNGKYP